MPVGSKNKYCDHIRQRKKFKSANQLINQLIDQLISESLICDKKYKQHNSENTYCEHHQKISTKTNREDQMVGSSFIAWNIDYPDKFYARDRMSRNGRSRRISLLIINPPTALAN